MSAPRLAAAFALLPLEGLALATDPAVERTIQLGLEQVQSQIPLSATISGGQAQIELRVLRTWKSVTGHYCRQYELRLNGAGQALTEYGTRCRDRDGIWKTVENK